MKTWFLGLSRGKQIVWSVLSVHVLCVLMLTVSHFVSYKKPKTSFTVHTVRLSPPAPQPVVASPSPVVAVKPKQTAKPSAPPKAAASKAIAAKKATTASPAPKVAPKPSPALLEQIEQSLTTLTSTTVATPKAALTIPKLLAAPEAPSAPDFFSATETVGAFLRESLELPEFGDVRATLWIDMDGHLIKMEILESKSAKNADFLKNRLPELQFPCLNKSTSMTVVFRNG
ncbi:MAG TPA: hypothetical protein VGM34_00760 [Chlamydiales bacterium]